MCKKDVFILTLAFFLGQALGDDILGCGGFVKADVDINFSQIEVKLFTKQGSLKYQTDCAPNNGYYYIPLYERGDYVLKVAPPRGWIFEPESVDLHVDGSSDKCSLGQDINFQFKGFGVVGKVISKGSSIGPAGITLTLKKEGKDGVVQVVTSGEGGGFLFTQILPGSYIVQATHAAWTFEKASTTISVVNGNGDVGSNLVVYGYDVKGKVLSEGEPIKGVAFILFSDTVQSKDIKNCDKSAVAGFAVKTGQSQPLCHVTSLVTGEFIFPSLPAGKYSLVPFYKGEHITFDVVPAELSFNVEHNTVILPKVFQVAGFSVVGHVLYAEQGKGVAGARVLLNGNQQAVTADDGSYHLENMKAGTYNVKVIADHVFFNEMSIKVTPNTPELPNVLAARFSICGQIQIDLSPEDQVARKRQITIQSVAEKAKVKTLTSDNDGKFCSQVAPGDYIIKPVVSDDERKTGLRLAPLEKEVKVIRSPIFGILFSQFRATIKGKVQCKEKCSDLEVAILMIGKLEERHVLRVNEEPYGGSFDITDLMPAKYRLSIVEDKWCWESRSIDFEIVDRDLQDLTFVHTGYVLATSLSHEVTLKYQHEKTAKNTGEHKVSKGVSRFCLSEAGRYKIKLDSCHQFEQSEYIYDTAEPSVLTLTAVRHLVGGIITSQTSADDVTVEIKSSIDEVGTTKLGPLKAVKSEDQKAPGIRFLFSYWARKGERIDVTPKSADLLFYPPNRHVNIHGDKCPGNAALFEARKGVFISGQVLPPLSGVTIAIAPRDKSADPVTIETDSKGLYRVGPLHSSAEYEVSAKKLGYVLSEVKGKQGHFKAHKLAEVIVKVTDEADQSLASVLLSLSGGVDYRSNKLTNVEGSMTFPELSPGQYFLRPVMKEYRFNPASKMIDVEEGKTLNLQIKATRVAFSCFGSVTSLNSEPEPGVLVEAVGLADCQQYQEESKTEADGSFRIRGLQPKCQYTVKLKSGELNQHIERTTPKNILVKPDNADMRDVHIIAFRRMNQLELSGNVITTPDILSTLKVQLLREDQDAAIHTVALSTTSFFYLPTLMIDNKKYVVRLMSTLSTSSFDFSLPEISFTANTTYKHFTFKFNAKRKPVEQELGPSSFLVLPVTLLIVALAYHYDKVMPTFSLGVAHIQSLLNNKAGGATGPSHISLTSLDTPPEGAANKKKVKPRRT